MRTYRRQQRNKMRCFQVQIGPADIDGLIAKRYLSPLAGSGPAQQPRIPALWNARFRRGGKIEAPSRGIVKQRSYRGPSNCGIVSLSLAIVTQATRYERLTIPKSS
jgi:hypothetical protein